MISPIEDVLSRLQTKHDIVEPLTSQEKVDCMNQAVGMVSSLDGYDCKICNNKGFVIRLDENGVPIASFCKCKKTKASLRRARRSGLGDIITDYTFDKFEATEDWQQLIKSKAMEFCKDDAAKWFYIGGQVGSGKTHVCTAIAAYYIKAGQDVKYMIWSEEAKKLKALANDARYQDEINIYKNVNVLYIDDFLKVKYGENPTTADMNLAFEIINHRLISRNKITIISSEKMLDELMEYDEATMSRIYQKTGVYKLSIGRNRERNYRLRDFAQI